MNAEALYSNILAVVALKSQCFDRRCGDDIVRTVPPHPLADDLGCTGDWSLTAEEGVEMLLVVVTVEIAFAFLPQRPR